MAFAGVGAVAALANLLARLAFNWFTSYEVAIVLAFPVGLTLAFILNRILVFSAHEGNWKGQYGRFLLVNLAALIQVFLVSVLLARVLFPAAAFSWHAHLLAHAIGVASPIFTSYWAHKHYSFAPARART